MKSKGRITKGQIPGNQSEQFSRSIPMRNPASGSSTSQGSANTLQALKILDSLRFPWPYLVSSSHSSRKESRVDEGTERRRGPEQPSCPPQPQTQDFPLPVFSARKLWPRYSSAIPGHLLGLSIFCHRQRTGRKSLFPVNRQRENYSYYCFDNGSPPWNGHHGSFLTGIGSELPAFSRNSSQGVLEESWESW
jgi:hypothetical protein